jgi:hypothetical protein
MAISTDGCLERTCRPKTASATVYLMEELGDARLRCDQLVRYLDEATKLIEQSPKKDELVEIAGHLIQGVPETAFKLQKALQAVALAADRLDYEELKQELRPEKVDELERVLQEARIRRVPHRSEIPIMNPKQAAEALRNIVRLARDEGHMPIYDVAAFLGRLDSKGVTAAAEQSSADQLEKLAELLESPTQEPISRVRLAAIVRRIAMEATMDEAVRLSSEPKLTQQHMQLADAVEVKQKFKAENPDISDEALNEIARQWQKNKDVVKDKTALVQNEGLVNLFDGIRDKAVMALRASQSGRWKPAVAQLIFLVDDIGTILVQLGSTDTSKSEALKREIRSMLPGVSRAVDEMEPVVNASTSAEDAKRSRFETDKPADPTVNMDSDAAKKWKDNTEEYGDKFKEASAAAEGYSFTVEPYEMKLDGRTKFQIIVKGPDKKEKAYTKLFNTEPQANDVVKDLVKGLKDGEGLRADSWEKKAADEHLSRFEEGVSADPTKNMSPEDAETWKEEHAKNKDNFKSAALVWKADAAKTAGGVEDSFVRRLKKNEKAIGLGDLSKKMQQSSWKDTLYEAVNKLFQVEGKLTKEEAERKARDWVKPSMLEALKAGLQEG